MCGILAAEAPKGCFLCKGNRTRTDDVIFHIDSKSFSILRLPEDLRLFRLLCPYMLVSLAAVKILLPPIRLTALIMLLPYADVAAEHYLQRIHFIFLSVQIFLTVSMSWSMTVQISFTPDGSRIQLLCR